MKPSHRTHRLTPLARWLITAAVVSLVGVTAGPWPGAVAAPLTGAPALQSTPPSTQGQPRASKPTRAPAASGPHSDGADAVLTDRQRADNASGGRLKRADQQFLTQALASGTAEVELARLAQSRAQNAELQRFAEHLVEDHTRVNGELRALGSRAGLDWPENRGMPSGSTSGSGPAGAAMASSSASASPLPSDAASGAPPGAGLRTTPGTAVNSGSSGSAGMGTPALSASAQRTMERLQGLSGADFDHAFVQQMVSDHKRAVADFQRAAARASDSDVRRFAQQTLPSLQAHLQQARTLGARLASRSR
ncbi:DUF4142 domain-containing protein [Pelomonas sp. APW6]|uniref:DUF4142 domain-containing protein n=1 Tax=Roseateles subflavus TaxID=3053353 RepID=A0ABT7LQ13_9BURK|nr:DUF4142 domain-containing protein [Pelomonas sp. APW6]MDL5033825.1 DUF4142 domain-containing protein [Pelomonas sp. APW6]